MNNKFLLSAIAAPVLLVTANAPSSVNFAPAEGSSAVKTFQSVVELTLDDMSVQMNGQDSPMVPDMEMNVTATQTVVVTDEYVSLRDNAPKTLRRTFDELSNTVSSSVEIEMMGQSQSQDSDIDSESELEGKTVVFKWNEDDEEYTKSFDPEDEDNTELLEDLFEDMDLRALLPDGDVNEGDEWEIEASLLATVLAPGGNLALIPEEAESDGGMMGAGSSMGSMSDWLSDLLEGDASGTFAGTREVDGRKLAVIQIKVDLSSARDMTEMVLEQMEDTEMPEEMAMEIEHVDIEYSLEGEGELLWDLEAGHARSFDLSGPTSVTMDTGMSIEVPGQGEMSIEQSMEMSGTTNISVVLE